MELNQGQQPATPLSDDVIRGMKNISRFVGEDERRCYYLAEKKLLRGVFKQGNCWIGLKKLVDHIQLPEA